MLLDPDFATTESDPVQWGILGPGMIARRAIMPAFALLDNAEVLAVASSDGARATAFATEFHIPQAYEGYQALIDDPAIEAVYIALPNHLHALWAIRAMEAGKHVLCEKPLAATTVDAAQMVAAAEEVDVIFMEAVMYRFHPRIQAVEKLVREGAIGIPQLVRSSFCFTLSDASNYRFDPDLGGGALLDVGSYCVNAARWIMDEEPFEASAQMITGESGIDLTLSGVLAFPSGGLAQVQCSFATAEHQYLDIIGTNGSIDLLKPFSAWHLDELSIRLMQATDLSEIVIEPANHYALMLSHFSDCVRDLCDPLLAPSDGLGTIRALAALRRAGNSGRTERV